MRLLSTVAVAALAAAAATPVPPAHGQGPAGGYGNPRYSNPTYANPSYSNPTYANPSYSNPSYPERTYRTPDDDAPAAGAPLYGGAGTARRTPRPAASADDRPTLGDPRPRVYGTTPALGDPRGLRRTSPATCRGLLCD